MKKIILDLYKQCFQQTCWQVPRWHPRVKAEFLSTLFSYASLGSALTWIGIVASVPLGGVAGVFALSSAAMVRASKKIQSKISKHQEIVTLPLQNVKLLTD